MCHLMSETNELIPLNHPDPIGRLVKSGTSVRSLSFLWGCSTTYIYNLKRYASAPSWRMARRMAVTFEWPTSQVMDVWERRVDKAKRAKGDKS